MIKEVISKECSVSETTNKVFGIIFPNLKIIFSENFETAIQYETENLVQNPINKFKNQPSTIMIISKINKRSKDFLFAQFPTMKL